MSVQALVEMLRQQGIWLVVDGSQIRVNAPVGAMTDELRRQLKGRKSELLEHLLEPPPPRDWRDLEAELDDAWRRYEAGEIDAEAVEQVAHRARRLARRLPEDAGDVGNLIPVATRTHSQFSDSSEDYSQVSRVIKPERSTGNDRG